MNVEDFSKMLGVMRVSLIDEVLLVYFKHISERRVDAFLEDGVEMIDLLDNEVVEVVQADLRLEKQYSQHVVHLI